MRSRRSIRVAGLAVALSCALSLLVAPVSQSAEPRVRGLYGSQSAAYDGVFRQSLAIIALAAAGQKVPATAVTWLASQQCADGGYEPFRASTAAACRPGDPSSYIGQDTNSAALASIALRTVGRRAEAARSLRWLRAAQNRDGGWPYYAGGASDANSTALAVWALRASGVDPASLTRSPIRYLGSVTLGCTAATEQRGAVAYMGGPTLMANDMATVQVLAALGSLPLGAPAALSTTRPSLTCPGAVPTSAAALAKVVGGQVARRLEETGGGIPNAFGPGRDYASTAWAVIGLTGTRVGKAAAFAATSELRTGARTALRDDKGQVLVARAALVLLAARSQGASVRDFGGVDLIRALESSLG